MPRRTPSITGGIRRSLSSAISSHCSSALALALGLALLALRLALRLLGRRAIVGGLGARSTAPTRAAKPTPRPIQDSWRRFIGPGA